MPWCPPVNEKQLSGTDDWKLIYTCTDEMEADMIESFLDAENIDTFRNYPGFSDISRIVGGMTKLGVNIYVREGQYSEAAKALRDLVTDFPDGDAQNIIQTAEKKADRNYCSIFFKILVTGFVLLFLFSFVPSVIAIIRTLLHY